MTREQMEIYFYTFGNSSRSLVEVGTCSVLFCHLIGLCCYLFVKLLLPHCSSYFLIFGT